jgi:secreted trypsin-like serine protease
VRLTAGSLIVLLGAHDLNKLVEIGRTFHAVYNIYLHPDWNTLTQSYDADISVLVLEKAVTFNEYVQPICMLTKNTFEASAAVGAVVGYGKSEDETKIHENIPKILSVPIHSNRDCFADNAGLATISSGRTFCGGPGRGVGVCTGDSGSGLIVTDGTAFYLRGIVSSSLINAKRRCDVDTYAVFTDVTKYIDWINGIPVDRFSLRQKR